MKYIANSNEMSVSNALLKCQQQNDILYTLQDLANIFKVGIRTIHNWRRDGVIPTFKLQGKVCMTHAMLSDFIIGKGGIL